MKKRLSLFILTLLPLLANAQTVSDVQKSSCQSETRGEEVEPMESLYGEWLLMGWNDGGNWVEVDKKKARQHHMCIEFKEDGKVVAHSMANQIIIGHLTLNGNEMSFDDSGLTTEVYCNDMENIFFEDHIIYIKSYQLDGKQLKLYYTDNDYFVFTKDFDDSEESNDYLPFVELGKQWHVVSNASSPYALERYQMFEEVERDGKIYAHTHRVDDEQGTYQDTGLFREENRRVYKYDEEKGRDIMIYDFSLKEGDTFTYEFGFNKPVNCKVLKQGWLENGPQIVSSRTINTDGTQETIYRHLRTWTIVVDDDSSEYSDYWDVTWIECIGALRNMFISQYMVGPMICLAYIERDGSKTDNLGNDYLPFWFHNLYGPVYGCDLPTGSTSNTETEDRRHHLTYELENDRLHVYGDVLTQCGPNNYAYFYEKSTEDPWVHKIEFKIQEVEPTMDCMALHATDFYVPVPGFDPSKNYIIVDNQGEEHPVIKKTTQDDYRPYLKKEKSGNTTIT